MAKVNIDHIKKQSLTGVLALTSRTFVLQIISFIATFLLTIFLSPAIFGIFYLVSAIISFLGYFSDIGLAAALIQKKEDLTDDDLKTTFTIQQLIVSIVVILAFVFSSAIGEFYRLNQNGLWLLRALIVSFFLSSLKTIPSILLERKLEFQKLVIPQIVETLSFYVIAVILAWQGLGVTSFTWAVLARGVVGLIAIYIVSPWRIRLGFSKKVFQRLVRFGMPFQFNSFLALIKDDLLTIYLGKVLPLAHVGYIGWAKKWAEIPLRLIMDNVIRVTFPAFSRMQNMKKTLGHAIEKALFGLTVSIFPLTISMLFFIQPVITIIPRYDKWQPALLSFYLFSIGSLIASLNTPLTNALNAIGRIKTTLALMIFWTVAVWLLTITFVKFYGFNGVSLALLCLTITVVLVVRLVQNVVPFRFFFPIRTAIIGSCILAGFYALGHSILPRSFVWLILEGSVGFIAYVCFVWKMEKNTIRELLVAFKK